MWWSQGFQRLVRKRDIELLNMTYDAWFQYILWSVNINLWSVLCGNNAMLMFIFLSDFIRCRKFNKINYAANLWHKKYCFDKLVLNSSTTNIVRRFYKKKNQKPLFLTFRALKRNALVNRYYCIENAFIYAVQ